MAMQLGNGRGGSRRRGRGGQRAPLAEINVTPLVDVMLVLLIIFMVTAPLLVTGVPVELPESRANAIEQPEEPIEISIDSSGIVYIGEDAVSTTELPGRLEALAAAPGADERAVILRGDKNIDYGAMMSVMGELNRAGLNSISLVTTGSGAQP
ncbi:MULTISPECIES: ExbD/TolR family protein [Novosphingopyxis]|uniref:ExbD/TolR family protein n=1 Tax=Novosphingopyxis TaxID=2709686 RepID=UPI00165143CB|nr:MULTISPECIES: ExbD/TolR family protein [Novosphingopyxis]MBH9536350.1 ExbD/TolR family protein [Novosphingopyxis sp. YJ-S2-01]